MNDGADVNDETTDGVGHADVMNMDVGGDPTDVIWKVGDGTCSRN